MCRYTNIIVHLPAFSPHLLPWKWTLPPSVSETNLNSPKQDATVTPNSNIEISEYFTQPRDNKLYHHIRGNHIEKALFVLLQQLDHICEKGWLHTGDFIKIFQLIYLLLHYTNSLRPLFSWLLLSTIYTQNISLSTAKYPKYPLSISIISGIESELLYNWCWNIWTIKTSINGFVTKIYILLFCKDDSEVNRFFLP